MKKLKRKELKHGDVVSFVPMTHDLGHAEFEFCAVWKRGKIQELYIYRGQQENVAEYFVVKSGHSESLCIHGWTHKGVQEPRVWRHTWCKEHKCTAIDVYVPLNSDHFTVEILSTLNISFDLPAAQERQREKVSA